VCNRLRGFVFVQSTNYILQDEFELGLQIKHHASSVKHIDKYFLFTCVCILDSEKVAAQVGDCSLSFGPLLPSSMVGGTGQINCDIF